MSRPSSAGVIGAMALLAASCNPEVPTATPDGAWRAFRKAVERSDETAAYALLSAGDQAALKARAADAGDKLKPSDMLSVDRRNLPPWRDMRVELDGERAVVIIVLDDGVEDRREAVLESVREPRGWRVVLGISPP